MSNTENTRTVNRVILVGGVGADPLFRPTDADEDTEARARLSVATRRQEPDGRDRWDWHRIRLSGRLARFARDHINRGDRIYLKGSIVYGSYQRDGVTIPTAEVEAREVVLLSPPENDEEDTR